MESEVFILRELLKSAIKCKNADPTCEEGQVLGRKFATQLKWVKKVYIGILVGEPFVKMEK
jgi:hypothetical protein